MPEAELHAILADNAVAFYRLPADRLREVGARIGPPTDAALGNLAVDEDLLQHMHNRSGYLRPTDPFFPAEIDRALRGDLEGIGAP